MKFGSSKRRSINKAALNMSSMIDVTFLLLIYFIVTTVLTPPEQELIPSLQVEEGTSTSQTELEPQIVNVKINGGQETYEIGGQLFTSRNDLSEVLVRLPLEPGLIVRVDGSTSVGFAIAAIQEARNAGFEKVTYVPTNP